MKTVPKLDFCQCGMATLTITVTVLIIVTLMVASAAKVGVMDQRMAGNEVRYKEAFAQAEAGLDYAVQKFNSEFKTSYDGAHPTTSLAAILTHSVITIPSEADGTSPESGEGSFTVAINPTARCFPVPAPPTTCTNASTSVPILNFVSTGVGGDGTGTATVQRQIAMSHVLGGKTLDVPLVIGGEVGIGGNFNVVANPNGGGHGVPVSVWSNDRITLGASSATCHQQDYSGDPAQCSNPSDHHENISRGSHPATVLTTHSDSMPDLLPNDPFFPNDLFDYVFGLPRNAWFTKKLEAIEYGQAASGCSPIAAAGTAAGNSYPLWWIDGDCAFSNDDEIGSDGKPVVLVIDDSEFHASGRVTIHGIVFLFDNPAFAGTPSAALNGTPEIQGSFISDVGGNAMQGNYAVVYDPDVIHSFSNGSGANFTLGYVPGSWRDF